jgi:hypothetical protein
MPAREPGYHLATRSNAGHLRWSKEHSMRRKDLAEPRLVERSQEPLVESEANDVEPTNIPEPSDETTSREAQIRELAFTLYERRECKEGCDVEDWLEAETIIKNKTKVA